VNNLSGSNDTSTVSSGEDSFIIEHLDACVEYEVSVTAGNAESKGDEAVTRKARTDTAGNYHTHIILLFFHVVAHKLKVMVKSCLSVLYLFVLFCYTYLKIIPIV
jgi:hypothetical protein